jgi:hypothetical protein
LNRYRRELERALKGLGVGVPARRLVQDKLAHVLAEQDSGPGSRPTASPTCEHAQ